MRALIGPAGAGAPQVADQHQEVDVHHWYSDGWLDVGGIRINVVASADGGIAVHGRSEGLQTSGDNRVFAALRDLADVVLVAAGTAKAEEYAVITTPPLRRARRRGLGMNDYLPTAIVTRRLDLDPRSRLFLDDDGNPPDYRTIVITCDAADADRRQALAHVADVVVVGDKTVDLIAARDALVDRGLRRIVCEGGPSLNDALFRADIVDELNVSISPMLVGPDVARLVAGNAWSGEPRPLRLVGLLTEENALFTRYRRDASA